MGRPKTGELQSQVSLKLDPEIIGFIDKIASVLYSDRSKIIKACLKLGIEEFKRKEGGLEKKIMEYEHRKHLTSLSHGGEEKKRRVA